MTAFGATVIRLQDAGHQGVREPSRKMADIEQIPHATSQEAEKDRRTEARRGRRGGLARRIDKSSIDETLARTGTPGPRACLGNGRTDMRPKKRGKPATALCARTAPGRARRKGLTARTGGRWRGCLKRSSSRPKRRRRAQEPITRRSQHAGAGGS
ncbi:unnamed protein product [Prorocentrum cordatum]|uniref:Uncharacterized protein n=2 Tax=Prorocentrum cordatum TaxID=2364126 RepID=A0ABN9PX69_9DINO|nr:unnamed protein product [Polarella glacialis]